MNNVFEKLNTKEIIELIDKIIASLETDINNKFIEKNMWEKEKFKILNKEE